MDGVSSGCSFCFAVLTLWVFLPVSIVWGSGAFLLLLIKAASLSCSVSLSYLVTHGTRVPVSYVQVPQEEGIFFLTES